MSRMARQSTLRFGAQTDEVTSLLRIVNLVRLGEATTRPELVRATGLGRGVVAQRVDQAMEMGYLEDGEFAHPAGGRAPRTLRFRAERGVLVECALGAVHIHVGISALTGDVIAHAHREWDIARGPAATLESAMAMIDELLATADGVPTRLAAAGSPATGAVAILAGLIVWNDFFTPLIFLGGSNQQTLPVAMYYYIGSLVSQWNQIFAIVILSMIPILAYYLFAQKRFIQGFAGGLKG